VGLDTTRPILVVVGGALDGAAAHAAGTGATAVIARYLRTQRDAALTG
jgi:hypothetical protein